MLNFVRWTQKRFSQGVDEACDGWVSPAYLLWLCRPLSTLHELHRVLVQQRALCQNIYVHVALAMCLPKSKRTSTHRRPMIETRYVAVFDPESCDLCRLPASKIDGELDAMAFANMMIPRRKSQFDLYASKDPGKQGMKSNTPTYAVICKQANKASLALSRRSRATEDDTKSPEYTLVLPRGTPRESGQP
ncbi:MAG: hypothetical protein Q9169_006993 [Polycauliona sp. 2 TL-2023]